MSLSSTPVRKLLLCAATAASFAAAAPLSVAQAQPDYSYRTGPDDEITVYGSRHEERSMTTGAPIQWVREQRVVYYGDLDLRTRYGAHMLKARVARAAQEACDDLDAMYPVTASGSPPCERTAYRDAMAQTPVGYYRTDWYGY
ncbi:MAG TPA: UrcA family protein [Caulobacteraceae bacterium]|nr:UrcA family protein [Caulobacteraceae bacterium]